MPAYSLPTSVNNIGSDVYGGATGQPYNWGGSTKPATPPNTNSSWRVPASAIAGSAIQAGAGITEGLLNEQQTDAARNQAIQMAEQSRTDTLAQQNIDYQFKQQQMAQKNKQFQQGQQSQNIKDRYDNFVYAFNKELDKQKQVKQLATSLGTMLNNSDALKQMVVKAWGA